MIDWITFETYSGIWYGIDGYCAFDQSDIDYYLDLDPSSDYYDWIEEDPECPLGYSHAHFCVDNDSCAPAKQILYFDVSTPNEYITDSAFQDGTAVVPQIETCTPTGTSSTGSTTKTPTTAHPTKRPTRNPSAKPTTPSPTSNPTTLTPTSNPSAKPTTAFPTQPG
eukprot:259334_1